MWPMASPPSSPWVSSVLLWNQGELCSPHHSEGQGCCMHFLSSLSVRVREGVRGGGWSSNILEILRLQQQVNFTSISRPHYLLDFCVLLCHNNLLIMAGSFFIFITRNFSLDIFVGCNEYIFKPKCLHCSDLYASATKDNS